jgi:hypothetical protein
VVPSDNSRGCWAQHLGLHRAPTLIALSGSRV